VSATSSRRSVFGSSVSALCLLVVVAIALTSAKGAEIGGDATLIASLGFLLLGGTLLSELLALIRLPHLTGYLLAGVIGGPHILGIVDGTTATRLAPVNTLALAMIALAGGAELRMDHLRRGVRSLLVAMGLHSLIGLAASIGTFLLLRRFIPFASALTGAGVVGVALLWGVLAISRSPSATLGILAQTHARGPVTTFSLAFVMSSDVVVVLLMAFASMIAKVLLEPGSALSMDAFRALGHEIVGSVSIGTTLGLMLVLYARLVGRQLVVVILGLGFGVSEVLRYLHFDPLLSFLVAGFIVQNLSKQGDGFLHTLEGMGSTVYVLFFASAGVDLDIPLLVSLWPIALLLALTRGAVTIGTARLASKLAGDSPTLTRWSWAALIAQAGLTQGMAGNVAHEFPTFGPQFRALVVATLAINAIVGPVFFKLALDRSRESKEAALLAEEEAA
jgi:Kef-type K+ transport system membrane component KefB